MVPMEWRLVRGGVHLATIRSDGQQLYGESPCGEGVSETTPAYEPLRQQFEREVELLDFDGEAENTEWADIWDELQAPGLFVESADGKDRFEVLWIHFRNGRAWWWPLFNSPRTVLRDC